MPGSERRSCSAAEAHAAARDPMDRRHSTSSESSLPEAPHFRQSSHENIEYIPTRTSKVTASKPAANPLQFVKIGPCDLYRSAQEQIRKVEEVKKIKQEKRDEAEDWQSNLDNWKSSRRKRQEHIIERVVEVKKFELEEYDRNRRRSKTFNEMMEERNSRGRKVSLVMFKNDDVNDLSDLGIGPTSAKSSVCGDNDHINELNLTNKEEAECRQFDNHKFESNSNGMIEVHDNNFHSEGEEYTYERAIQSYVNFAETRVKSKSPGTNSYNEQNENLSRLKENLEAENGNIPNGHDPKKIKIPPPLPAKPKKGFEIRRQSSGDLNSIPDNNRKLPLPKVDVLKKREIFEKAAEASTLQPKIPSDFSNSKSIKNRILSIENKNEVNNQSAEYVATVHERITSIQKQISFDSVNEKGKKSLRLSDNEKSSLNSVNDDISRVTEDLSNDSNKDSNYKQGSWKDINSNLKVTCEIPGNDVIRDSIQNQDAHYVSSNHGGKELEHEYVHPVKCFTSTKSKVVSIEEDLLQSKPKFHRSLDSLDMEGSSGCGNETFERVQSLEDLDCCSHTMNYPPSSSSTEMFALSCLSGDTDREDSGIHTADVSCSVSQADEPVEDGEIVTMISSVIPHLVLDKNGKKDYHLEVQLVQHKQADDCTMKSECSSSLLSENSLNTDLAMINLSDKPTSDSSTSHNSVACGFETETITQNEVITQEESDGFDSSQVRIDKVPINLIEEVPNGLKKDDLEISYYGNKDKEEESIIPAFTNQIPPLSLSGDIEIVDGLPFPLGTLTSAEPPKEKPPPPPEYLSDEDAILKESTLRRLDSTKRIKKEIRRKRSDFLGIEGKSDDSYFEPELQVAPPPDMTSFLMEEQRLEKELYRQSICSESDSNHGETTESRDSGVELEKGISDDTWPTKQLLTPDVLSAGHSRQNSEIFGNASMTSEEDEITKKEREIIEILEKEEQWRYGTQQNHIGEKLAEKLRLLEEEKMRLEWERAEEANRRESEELARMDEELRLKTKEAELRQQETTLIDNCDKIDMNEGDVDGAALQSERTRLQKQQEELVRQQESLLHAQCWGTNVHSSLQDVSCKQPTINTPPVVYSYRYSLPDLQQEPEQHVAVQQLPVQPLPRTSTTRYAPPPIPPAKPIRNIQEQREREHSIRNSRMPSADCIPKQLENSSATLSQTTGQQMSKQTRQALSAAPRPRFISTDNWIQAKKKPEVKRNSLNNHHWLIQEAEHRRITEQQHRNAMSPRKVPPSHAEAPQLWAQKQQQPVLRQEKPLPDSIIQTLTQRVQNRVEAKKPVIRPRVEESPSRDTLNQIPIPNAGNNTASSDSQEKILSVSGKKKCSHCGDELGRGAAMIIESLRLFYHIDCFKCCVCHVQLGDGLMGTDVRVRNNKLHCHNCYSSDDGVKFSCV